MWEVEGTDEFETWFGSLKEDERESVAAAVGVLEVLGPSLRFPRTSAVRSSRHGHMRELRIQHLGIRFEFCMHLTLEEQRYCCSVETRPATTGGTTETCRLQMPFTTRSWRN